MGDISAPYLNRSGQAPLDDEAFGAKWNEALVHECVRAELNARRQGTASTRTRGQVRGGGAKPWRQKGTGRARAGSIRPPHWAGGGVAFGPSPRVRGRCPSGATAWRRRRGPGRGCGWTPCLGAAR